MRALLVALVALVAWIAPAQAAPPLHRAAGSGRITMYAEPGLESTAQELAAGAETTLARISEDLVDLPVPQAVEVRLVRDARDLASVAPAGRGAPAYAVGVAYPDRNIVSVALRRGHEVLDARSTLDHELAHIALGVALGERAPHWLHEGFAYQHSGEWSWDRMETLAGMAWFGGIIELNELDSMFPQGEAPTHRAYAESYDFVGFLSRRGRWDDKADDGDRWPFRRFLTLVGRTGDLDTAAKTAFGRPLHELFEEWRTDLTKRYMLVPIGLLGLALWILCALLLVVAWWRRRRQNRRRIALWDEEDRKRREAAPPAYFAKVGEEPLVEPPLPPDDERLN
ncbi:MAG: hypothetical protein SFX73_19285 [Kofleriaceae bacterium]|nr:hypothetical protein [Kofleriaceae bacterium]